MELLALLLSDLVLHEQEQNRIPRNQNAVIDTGDSGAASRPSGNFQLYLG